MAYYNIKQVIMRIKEIEDVALDVDVARALRVLSNDLVTWKRRGTIPLKRIIIYCYDRKINPLHILTDWRK